MMFLVGLTQALWLLFVFPPLQRRIGTNGVMRLCGWAYPWWFAIMPLAVGLRRQWTAAATTIFWVVFPPCMAIGSGVSMSFTAIQLAVNDVSPGPHVLGTLNALALAAVSGIRAFSPVLFSGLFAAGARTQWLWGYAIWGLMAALAAGFTVAVHFLPDYELLKKRRLSAGASSID